MVPLSIPEVNLTNAFICLFLSSRPLPFHFLTFFFLVGEEDMEIVVEVCNVMVCTTFQESIYLSVCVPENRNDLYEETFLTVCTLDPSFLPFLFLISPLQIEEEIQQSQLEGALSKMLAVGESLDECESFFDELILLTRQYIAFSLSNVDNNSSNLADTTMLMELLGVIGERSCDVPVELYEDLAKVSFFFFF